MSLAAVGQWIRSLGQLDPEAAFGQGPPFPRRTLPQAPEIAALAVELKQAKGDKAAQEPTRAMTAIKHSAVLSETPVREGEAPTGLDVHLPKWLDRG